MNADNLRKNLLDFLLEVSKETPLQNKHTCPYEKLLTQYTNLKNALQQPKDSNMDFISLIIGVNNGKNGWRNEDSPINTPTFFYNKLEQQAQEQKFTQYNFSKNIAFRKELILSAIKGGYLANIMTVNILRDHSSSPIDVKDFLENCPHEVLAISHKKVLNMIKSLRNNDSYFTPENIETWKDQFISNIASFSQYKPENGFFKKIRNNIKIVEIRANYREITSPKHKIK